MYFCNMKRIVLFLLLTCLVFPAKAFQIDNVQVSLITLLPRPNEVYTIYGHTALRVYDPVQHIDAVFNWGTFDFSAPNFLYRFIKGETDYFLSYTDYQTFLQQAALGNATVEEQWLDMPPEGKAKLLQALSENVLPQNRVYRYNFLFDNCTTRVRDMIEYGMNGELRYPESTERVTFRELIHSCTEPYPWMTFGIDLVIGNGADSLISLRRQLFLPLHLKQAMDSTYRLSSVDHQFPLVLSSEQVSTSLPTATPVLRFWDSPMKVGLLVLFVYLAIAVVGKLKHRRFRGLFAPLFLVAGAAGSLILFMVLFSEHPCMSPNWNLLWLHPLHWIGFIGCFGKERSKSGWASVVSWYHALNFVLLLGVLIGWCWVPQALNPGDIPFVLCLMGVSGHECVKRFKDKVVTVRRTPFTVCLIIVLSSLTTSLQAQPTPESPRLIVSIVIDQLRGDYLKQHSSLFGEHGFKRLMNGGLAYYSVDFGFPNLSKASSVAGIYTGSYPYYNGITGNCRYDLSKGREMSIVADDRYMGNYTAERLSPLSLLASTLGDELKMTSQGQSLVYALAPDAAQAILSGGQYADGAFWLDDTNSKWATSTYYADPPWFVERYNKSLIAQLRQTSQVNREVTDLATKFIENAGLGNHVYADMLAITYYAGNYASDPETETYPYGIRDLYYYLDKELERLFDQIDRKIGLRHTLIVLTSTGYYDAYHRFSEGFKPAGVFYPNRCTALLNLYLMAIYGQGDWVSAYYNHQIYLNKKLAEEKQVKWAELVRSAAEFTAQFSGVQDVTTAGQWLMDDTGRSAVFRRGMHKQLSGDIFIELQPGWVVANETHPSQPEPVRENEILSPLFILGESVPKAQVNRRIKMTEIAPTLAYLLRIRTPNACRDLALPEVLR